MSIRTEKIEIFDPATFMEQFRKLSVADVVQQIERNITQVVKDSEDSFTGLIGTVCLADGRQARVELKIDAEFITKDIVTKNLDLFEKVEMK